MPGDPNPFPEPRRCPDDGRCHHECAGPCWRTQHCAPLSVYGETWMPFPHLVAAVQAELQALDPSHGWEVTSGYAGDAEVPLLRVDRTGPERYHPMVNLGPLLSVDPAQDYAMSLAWAPMIARYVVSAGEALDILHPGQVAPPQTSWQAEAAEALANAARARRNRLPEPPAGNPRGPATFPE